MYEKIHVFKRPSVYVFLVSLLGLFFQTLILFSLIGFLSSIATTLSKKVGNFFDRLVVTFLVWVSNLMALGAFGWLLGFNISNLLVIIQVAFIAIIFIIIDLNKKPVKLKHKKINFQLANFLPFIFSIFIFIFLLYPQIAKFHTNYIYQYISYSSDNLSHLELINVVDENNGYKYEESKELSKEITKALVGYPQGLHLTFSISRDFVSQQYPQFKELRGQLFYYVLITSFFYALFVYIFTRVSIYIVGRSKLSLLLITTSLLILFLGPFLTFYLQGFHTHLFALTLLLSQIYILCIYGSKNIPIQSRYPSYFIVLMLAVGISFTWLFILPLSLLACAIIMLPNIFQDIKNQQLFKYYFSGWALLYVLVIFIALLQMYIQLKFSIKSDPLTEPGNIAPTRQQYVIIIGLSSFVYYKITKDKIRRQAIKILLVFTVVSAVFALAIFLYQAFSVGQLAYYYYKAAYSVIVLGTISTVGLIYFFIRKSKFTNKLYQKIFIGTLSILFISAGLAGQFFAIKNGEVLGLQPPIANELGEILNDNDSNENSYVIVGSCNRNEDYLANRLISTVSGDHNTKRQAISFTHIDIKDSKFSIIEEINKLSLSTNTQIHIIDMSGGLYENDLKQNLEKSFNYKTKDIWKIENRLEKCTNTLK